MAQKNLTSGYSETTAIEDTDTVAIKKDSGDGLWRYMTGANLKANTFQSPTSSTDPALAFGSWRTPNSDRPVLLQLSIRTRTDGSTSAIVLLDIDESGGTSADYTQRIGYTHLNLGANTDTYVSSMYYIPAGASYQIRNSADPAVINSIEEHREFIL